MNRHAYSRQRARVLLALCLSSILLGLTLFFPSPPRAHAASLTVNTLLDNTTNSDGLCTLREAITAANNNANFNDCTASGYGADTITLPIGTIVLSSTLGYLQVTDNLTINGPGILYTWISGSNAVMVLRVNSGVTLNLSNLGIVYGYSGNGGGILNYGTLNVTDLLFYSNSSTLGGGGIANVGTMSITNTFFISNGATSGKGGAIWQGSGTTTISNTYIFSNTAVSDGGGIYYIAGIVNIINSFIYSNTAKGIGIGGGIYNGGFTLNITNSALYSNTALAGGGIYNFASRVTLNATTIYSNYAGDGAGIFNDGFGIANINQSTLSGNIASNGGGGIWNQVGTVALTNTTVYSNSATEGGGAYHNIGDLNITNSTIANNNASSEGGGIRSFSALTVTNSTFSGNSTAILRSNGTTKLSNTIFSNSSIGNCVGIITNGGNNIDDGSTCGWGSASGSMSNTNPKLGPLANNGGATQTMALLPGSPAIDGVTFNAPNGCPTIDQRGAQRPMGPRCDIGAYEAGYLFLPLIFK